MDHEGAGCQTPKGPILCINNCGFFGSAATMNMCSKCHREMILKQAQAKMVDASFDTIMNENRSSRGEKPVVSTKPTNLLAGSSNNANVVKATEGFSSAVASVEMRNVGKGSQAPERPILCTNCGFFGRSATMNMCPKCYKESILEQGEAKLVASSLDSKVNDIENNVEKNPVVFSNVNIPVASIKPTNLTVGSSNVAVSRDSSVVKDQEGPSRCSTCRKRVGLTGFTCRCGNLYCSMHRYSDMHNCQFDYRAFSRDSIAKANPVVKTKKLDKI